MAFLLHTWTLLSAQHDNFFTFWNQQTNRSSKTPIQIILCMKTAVKSQKANVFWSVFYSTPFVPFCIKLTTKNSSLAMWGRQLLFSFQWNMCPLVALFLTSDSPHFGVLLLQTVLNTLSPKFWRATLFVFFVFFFLPKIPLITLCESIFINALQM